MTRTAEVNNCVKGFYFQRIELIKFTGGVVLLLEAPLLFLFAQK